MQETKKKSVLGCLLKGAFWNLCVGLFALLLGAIFGGPKMAIEEETARIAFFVFLGIYLAITIWSVIFLAPQKTGGGLQTGGPYRYVRHPMYSAIIFVLNPALAILLRSWLLLLACLLVYFVWRSAIKNEEKELTESFGESYLRYKKTTWPFFPNLFKINKSLFFALTGLAVFIVVFVALNFQSFYLRTVEWEKEDAQQNTVQKPSRQRKTELPAGQSAEQTRPKYNKQNSVVIEKTNTDAPLVFSSGVSQKELNQALNQGVVVYPGSVLPGQSGNLFLTGHSSTYPWNKTDYGQVFALLDKLEPGDAITVYYDQYRYEYQVTKKYVASPDKVSVGGPSQAKSITLMTCWPIGTTWKRLIIEGVMIN